MPSTSTSLSFDLNVNRASLLPTASQQIDFRHVAGESNSVRPSFAQFCGDEVLPGARDLVIARST
jgi:hypothetical protein